MHGLVASGAILTMMRVLRGGDVSPSRRALLFCAATLLTLPYVADYDLVILLVPAILYLGEHREWPTPTRTLFLFALASVGAWLRLVTEPVGLQFGPLLFIVLLVGAALPTLGGRPEGDADEALELRAS